ncbi:unnamed protein product [Phaedon cochleariae]|uniref:Uncharacterized protein n=1 Tax=Phaedon cochleariae TaxID=80249 RepID=A0A9N9SQG5_PHACE|nr:unnamed protein product [Phaedon cochleariae]
MNYVYRSERAEWLLSLRNPSSQPNRENIPNIRIDEVKKNLFSNDSNSEAGIYTVETKNSGNITDDATKKTLEVQELLVINNELIPVQENLEENQPLLDDSESSVSESRNVLVNITNSDQKEVISGKRVRKRKATPETWKKNIRKKKRETGEEYVNIKEFNISFYKPKKDRCDKCEEFKAKKDVATDEEKFEQEEHLRRKEAGYIERNKDRELKKIVEDGEQTAVITFDLQNVYTLPKIGVKNFYYKCKLNVYNLTAHCNINNQVYNCIWHECNGGRTGNDLASALVKILGGIADDNPFLTKIILWSDSCVPQNKNSYMTMALKYYLDSPMCNSIRIIEHKYGEPGHGNVQEIDVAHSIIEKFLRNVEIAVKASTKKI